MDVLTGMPNYPAGKLFNGYEGTALKKDSHDGVSIFRVPIFLRGSGSNIALSLNYLSFVLSACIFGYLKLNKKYNAVLCYGTSPILQAIPAILLAKKNKAPIILNVQDLWPESISATERIHSPFVIWALSKIVSWIYKCSDTVLIQSEAFRDSILKIRSNVNIVYWPNSVDPLLYRNQEESLPSNLAELFSENKFTITFAGNIGSAQSIETIVEAAFLLRDQAHIKIILLGDGSKRAWALQEVKDRGLSNLCLPGGFPERLMPTVYRKSSCLLASLSNKNIFSLTIPNKIQGYLAQGRPIIGSMNGIGAKVILDAKVGLTASAESPHLLAKIILEMSKKSKSDLDHYGRNGRAYFMNHFEHDHLMSKLDRILKGS